MGGRVVVGAGWGRRWKGSGSPRGWLARNRPDEAPAGEFGFAPARVFGSSQGLAGGRVCSRRQFGVRLFLAPWVGPRDPLASVASKSGASASAASARSNPPLPSLLLEVIAAWPGGIGASRPLVHPLHRRSHHRCGQEDDADLTPSPQPPLRGRIVRQNSPQQVRGGLSRDLRA